MRVTIYYDYSFTILMLSQLFTVLHSFSDRNKNNTSIRKRSTLQLEGNTTTITRNNRERNLFLNPIICPFFNLLKPDTSNSIKFVADASKRGNAAYGLLAFLNYQAIVAQKGLGKALVGESLDIYNLDKIPGVSHLDLYQVRFDDVKLRFTELADINGFITLNDMINVKKWVANDVGVTSINKISRGETVFLFNLAGGDISTKVKASIVLDILEGKKPLQRYGKNNISLLLKGLKSWNNNGTNDT